VEIGQEAWSETIRYAHTRDEVRADGGSLVIVEDDRTYGLVLSSARLLKEKISGMQPAGLHDLLLDAA